MSREGWTRVAVRRTYLELRSLEALRPARAPREPVELTLRRPIEAADYLSIYSLVGERWLWRDRLAWTVEELERYLANPDVYVWSAQVRDRTAGYFELKRHPDRVVPLVHYGAAWDDVLDLAPIPSFDLPAGLPSWTTSATTWAVRGEDPDAAPTASRITVTIPEADRPIR